MTIALAVLVSDGMVMAADSATSLAAGPGRLTNVYDSADKVFNLYRGRPIGAFTAGMGNIGKASIATIAKDLRHAFHTGVPIGPSGYVFDPTTYTVEEVAIAARQLFYEDMYMSLPKDQRSQGVWAFVVGGYSAGASHAELWQVSINSGKSEPPIQVRPAGDSGILWVGEGEALNRLVLGFSQKMPAELVKIGLNKADVDTAMALLKTDLDSALAPPPMPIQEAIDLARFLAETAIQYSRFKPGAPTVGGPVDIAAITKHEGFRWVQRKHYYDITLNPTATVGGGVVHDSTVQSIASAQGGGGPSQEPAPPEEE